jgi:hypothetical protein|tara:strand:- start:379 stop:549 length:171 start_codon:yes stop_codon:yes gene_type:complete
MTLTLEEIKEKIILEYDPDLIIEVLEITTEELLDNFEDKLIDNLYKFDVDENNNSR